MKNPVRLGARAATCFACTMAVSSPLWAGSFKLGPLDGEWQMQGSYVYSIRTENPHPGVVATGGRKEVEAPEWLKWPESNNFDDGDRNFDKWDAVNNRATLLGELQLKWGPDFGMLVRGDAFYDMVYRQDTNANDSPESISTSQDPYNSFTDEARFFSGKRARLLDAYGYGSWYLPGNMVLNLRAGKHIAAWGESLFFSGVALAQAPADATKATVPGADVKSILLPVNQVSFQLAVNNKLTLLGQYKLEFKEIELNPVGEFFSPADVVGPGAEFIYGIRNPLYSETLANYNLASTTDLNETIQVIADLFIGPGAPNVQLLPDDLLGELELNLPELGQLDELTGAPRGIDPQRRPDIVPSDHGQWGFGLRYALNYTTTIGAYHLRYHATTPAPRQNYGYGVLLYNPVTGEPAITTEQLGDLLVPTTYNIVYYPGVHLTALSLSTVLFGVNFGAELIYRDGVDVLVDVYAPILGPVPTPTRAETWQALLSWLYVLGPGPLGLWDSMAIVGEAGFVHVEDYERQYNPSGEIDTGLTNTRDAAGVQMLFQIGKRNIFSGWDLNVPIGLAANIAGKSALNGGLGSLFGEDDYRASVGAEFIRLNKLTLGLVYNAYFGGTPNFNDRPYQDRDNIAFTAKYAF